MLDSHQQEVVDAPSSSRQVVIAGAGTGKTAVVAARTERLLVNEEIDPSSEILIVSFSRAAIAVVEARLRALGIQERGFASTIDALATRILVECEEELVIAEGFDARVARAAALLEDGRWLEGEGFLHIVVDEAQDIVGERARLVAALLAGIDDECGFTVLGDPAQGIYDFAEQGAQVRRLLDSLGPIRGVVETALYRNYRALSRHAQSVAHLVAQEERAIAPAIEAISDSADELENIDGGPDLLRYLKRWNGKTALLTRTNGEALIAARLLRDLGVHPHVEPLRDDVGLAPWLVDVVGGSASGAITRDEFEAGAVGQLSIDLIVDSWRALRRYAAKGPATVDRARVRALLVRRPALDPWFFADYFSAPDVVISTVHRAKGREFDNVVIARTVFGDSQGNEEDTARVTYVALSRARQILASIDLEVPWNLRFHRGTARWYLGGKKAWQVSGVEVRPADIEPVWPEDEVNPSRVVPPPPGTAVELKLDVKRSTLEAPSYLVNVGGDVVAKTSQRFGTDLAALVGTGTRRTIPWPHLYDAVTLDRRSAVITDTVTGRSALVPSFGVASIARLDWRAGQ